MRAPPLTPYGYHWEVVHIKSGQVVNDGFTRTDPPTAGPIRVGKSRREFTVRVTALVSARGIDSPAGSRPEDRADGADQSKSGDTT